MLMSDFVNAIKTLREEAMSVGKPAGDGKEFSGRRSVPVAKMKARINAAEAPKEVAKPKMGEHKVKKPTADIGKPTNDGIKFSGRIPAPVEKMKESLEDFDLTLED
jgi:hypothetical protein